MIRLLTESDAVAFRELRLRGLREHPEAFLITADEEARNDAAEFARRFREGWSGAEGGIFGAFENGVLAGLCAYHRERPAKYRHKAFIWGMYVPPELRGRGLGRDLLGAAIAALRAIPEIRHVTLAVTTVNDAARALYRALGFKPYGVEPAAMHVGSRWLDEEFMILRLRE